MATYLEEVQFELNMAIASLAMDDVYHSQLHVRKAEAAFNIASLPQEVYATCVQRGVVVDDDFIRLDMGGRAMFAPIVAKPFNDDGTCRACGCELPGQHFEECTTLIQGRYGWAHGETIAQLAARVGGYSTGTRMCDECFDMVYPKAEDADEDGWIKCSSCGEKTFKVIVAKPWLCWISNKADDSDRPGWHMYFSTRKEAEEWGKREVAEYKYGYDVYYSVELDTDIVAKPTEICPFCGAEGCQWDCEESSACESCTLKEQSVPYGAACLECKHYNG